MLCLIGLKIKIGYIVPQKYKINFGSLSKVGRWKKQVEFDFKLCQIEIKQPYEAKCCQVFHDTHFDNRNLDNDDPSSVISFQSLI